MLKLVATDLDGTLLHTDGTVTPRTREALTAIEEQGVAVAVSKASTISAEIGLRVSEVLRAAIPDTTFALEKSDGFAKEAGFMPRVPPPPDLEIGPLTEIFDDDVVKLLVRHEDMDPEKFWAEVESHVGDTVTTTWSSTGALVEISAQGVSKASTLALLCEERGINPAEVIAFGDMPNDLPLLEWSGTSYAMANAHPMVRELADHVAPSNDADGVAATLEQLFALPGRGAQRAQQRAIAPTTAAESTSDLRDT